MWDEFRSSLKKVKSLIDLKRILKTAVSMAR